MLLGNIFTIIVSVTIGLFGVAVALGYKYVPLRFRTNPVFLFSLAWLLLGIVWLATAMVSFLRYTEHEVDAIRLTYVLQMVLGASMVMIAVFIHHFLFGPKYTVVTWVLYGTAFALFAFTLFQYGVVTSAERFFANHITTSGENHVVFSVMFVPIWISALTLVVGRQQRKVEFDRRYYRFYLLSLTSLIVIGIAGGLDELGLVHDWLVTGVRLISLVAAIAAYAAVAALQESDELVI